MRQECDHEGDRLRRGPQAVKRGACRRGERLVALRAEEPFVLPRVETNIALACVASSGARHMGAEYSRGVHDDPPGCAWKHCQEKYVWTPVSLTTSLHHGLVWSYLTYNDLGKIIDSQIISACFHI